MYPCLGDNDIGGEGNDMVTLSKLDRFNREFGLKKPVIEACANLGKFRNLSIGYWIVSISSIRPDIKNCLISSQTLISSGPTVQEIFAGWLIDRHKS